ncbi:hypothetical protein HFN20_23965 [Paenibacillus dendritiformis]|uniref:hypothetical protein n=1 Tax=Paenibacillus dendritiformis TaxID=130049 RepID=UPI00143D5023|nr:hypothetical protein [Paenibacillus dendritiformis]NKI24230.1 hypothetical protein [Paenibacillus dendritiformis]NRG00790.1 hypothetical protein [Paenibacillus dendritiformis]
MFRHFGLVNENIIVNVNVSIASFGDLAQVGNGNDNENKNDNINNAENRNDNNNINVFDDGILSSITKQPANQKPTGIYFESDVLEKLQELTKGRGRGAQGKLVNDVVKRYFIEKGFLSERRE